MKALLVVPFLLAATTALAQGNAQPTPRLKLQDIPLPDESSEPPAHTEGGVEVHDRRFWHDTATGRRAADLEVKINRIWTEGGDTFANVTVRNTSPYELGEITVRCNAVTQEGRELGSEERTFSATTAEPMRQGYAKELRITLADAGAKVGSVSCNARGY